LCDPLLAFTANDAVVELLDGSVAVAVSVYPPLGTEAVFHEHDQGLILVIVQITVPFTATLTVTFPLLSLAVPVIAMVPVTVVLPRRAGTGEVMLMVGGVMSPDALLTVCETMDDVLAK